MVRPDGSRVQCKSYRNYEDARAAGRIDDGTQKEIKMTFGMNIATTEIRGSIAICPKAAAQGRTQTLLQRITMMKKQVDTATMIIIR